MALGYRALGLMLVAIRDKGLGFLGKEVYPKALGTHILRLLGPKTIMYEAFRLLWAIGMGL